MAGLGANGFEILRLQEIKSSMETDIDNVFTETVDFDPSSPNAQIVGIYAEALAVLWEIGHGIYAGLNPETAEGAELDKIGAIIGLPRQTATQAIVTVTVHGTDGTVIPVGSLIAINGVDLASTTTVTIDTTGSVPLIAQATATGQLTYTTGDTAEIKTPVAGWDSISGIVINVSGREAEKDNAYRIQLAAGHSIRGTSSIDALIAGIRSVPGVTGANVLENRGNVTSASGIPPQHISAVVSGGSNADVAKMIFTKTLGIGTFGDVSVNVDDIAGYSHPIKFSRPIPVALYITVQIRQLSNWPANGDQIIGSKLATEFTGRYTIGQDVFSLDLAGLITSLSGFTVVSMTVGRSSGTQDAQLSVAYNEQVTLDSTNIDVIHV